MQSEDLLIIILQLENISRDWLTRKWRGAEGVV